MIALNLLPPIDRQRLRSQQRERQLLRSALLIFVALFVVTGFAQGAAIWMEERTAALQHGRTPGASATPLVAIRSEINERAGLVQNLLQGVVAKPAVVSAVIDATPATVQLSQLTFDATTGTVELTGKGQSRSDVLAFRTALEQLPTVTRVEAPLSTLAQRTGVGFTFTITLTRL